MAWPATLPTFVAGMTAGVAAGLQKLSDALATIGNPWTTDARSAATIWTCSGTNPTLGNGTLVAKYRLMGKTLDWQVTLTFGTTTNPGTGSFQFVLPFPAKAVLAGSWYGRAYDSGATQGYTIDVDLNTTTIASLRCLSLTAGGADRQVNATQPFTFGATDVVIIEGTGIELA